MPLFRLLSAILAAVILSASCHGLFESSPTAPQLTPAIPIVTAASEELQIISTDSLGTGIYIWRYRVPEEDRQRLMDGWTLDFVASYSGHDQVWLHFFDPADSTWIRFWDFSLQGVFPWYKMDVWDYLDGPDSPPAGDLLDGTQIMVRGRDLQAPPSIRVVSIHPDISTLPLPVNGVYGYCGTLEEGLIRLTGGYYWCRHGVVEEYEGLIDDLAGVIDLTPEHIWCIEGYNDPGGDRLVWIDRETGIKQSTPLSEELGWKGWAVIGDTLIGNPILPEREGGWMDWVWVRFDVNSVVGGCSLTDSVIDTLHFNTRYRPYAHIESERQVLAGIYLYGRWEARISLHSLDGTLIRQRRVPLTSYWEGLVGNEGVCAVVSSDLLSKSIRRTNRYWSTIHEVRPRIWIFPWD